jgi:hypothetical protein
MYNLFIKYGKEKNEKIEGIQLLIFLGKEKFNPEKPCNQLVLVEIRKK